MGGIFVAREGGDTIFGVTGQPWLRGRNPLEYVNKKKGRGKRVDDRDSMGIAFPNKRKKDKL